MVARQAAQYVGCVSALLLFLPVPMRLFTFLVTDKQECDGDKEYPPERDEYPYSFKPSRVSECDDIAHDVHKENEIAGKRKPSFPSSGSPAPAITSCGKP